MTTEQGPEDVGGPLGWEPPPPGKGPPCAVCGTRNRCETCDPESFNRDVVKCLRELADKGKLKLFAVGGREVYWSSPRAQAGAIWALQERGVIPRRKKAA